MFEKLELTRMAQALAANSGQRMGLIARNIANADTPGYQAVDLPDFAQTYRQSAGAGHLRATRPGHFSGATVEEVLTPRPTVGAGAPNGNTVSLEGEMVKAVEVRQDHEMALSVYRSTSDILRASLGRSK